MFINIFVFIIDTLICFGDKGYKLFYSVASGCVSECKIKETNNSSDKFFRYVKNLKVT